MTFVSYDINAGKPQLLNPMRFMEHEFKDCIYQTIKKYISTDETIFYNTKRVKKLLEQLNMHKPNLTEQEYKELYLAICYQDVKYNFVDESFTKDECVNILKKDWGKVLSESEFPSVQLQAQILVCCVSVFTQFSVFSPWILFDLWLS